MELRGSWKRPALVALFLLLGSSNPVALKAALSEGWHPFTLGLWRMGFIGLFFLAWAGLAGENPLGIAGAGRRWSFTAAACKGFAVLCFYLALTRIPVSRAVIIATISPLANLLLVHFLLEQEQVRRRHLCGIGLAFAGMLSVLLVREGPGAAGSLLDAPTPAGDLLMIASVFLHQAMIVFEKRALLAGATPRQLVVSTNLVSVAFFALMVLLSAERAGEIPRTAEAIYLYLYLISFAGVILFHYRRWLVSVTEVSYLNSFSHAGKALSLLYAALLLGERIPAAGLVGFAFIVAGTAVAAGRGRELNGAGPAEMRV